MCDFSLILVLGSGMAIIYNVFILFGAYLLDRALGDPNRLHPIITFGRLIAWGEKRFNHGEQRQRKGMLYNASLIILVGLIGVGIEYFFGYSLLLNRYPSIMAILIGVIVKMLIVFYMISGTTLIREVRQVFEALDRSLEEGRKQVGRIVGRDTQSLSRLEVQTAALETLSENLSDGVIAPLFWYMILGLPGILMYKMINTQDSMIGYKTERYLQYGRFSALIDDLVNYIPARLTAWLMLLSVRQTSKWSFVRRYGREHASPNSGYPEAALAGVLNCRFGGPHHYFGQEMYKPYIGEHERELTSADAELAIRINRRSELLMLGLCLTIGEPASWAVFFIGLSALLH